ncbi:TonB-dependent receptor (plasmid) [Polymorphobacter sp. PAMC 29334]|uniref:TonB-dependent receptor domain-containing protein n=1 Tax=Polymorphobacter sp. PAMC 29334 TaxID=2862331 RepID=UPI001C756F48|nr:TonB-dependent receptor [Polymorphobacter sp. PAMC 29334]QYE33079.1 TonB-dependent receptor [Polymorphobacter sp. PAMC 29334]
MARSKIVHSRLLASAGIALAVLGAPALAQTATSTTVAAADDTGAAVGDIVVTGSRIPRAGFDTLQPAQTISGKLLDDRAFLNAADALNELSAFGTPGSNNTGQQSATNIGQQFVNLYNLGAQRTLVLVNGRRFVSGNAPTVGGTFGGAPPGQEVDLNTIPVGLIDHIEVLSVGGAPIYGADAIAGTVNVILKDKFQGLQVEAQDGVTRYGDGTSYVVRGLAGSNFADDRGNITATIEYQNQDGLTYLNRPNFLPYATFQPSDACTARGFNACYVANATVPSIFPGGIPAINAGLANSGSPAYPNAIHNAAGQVVAFAPDGTLQPVNLGIQNNGLVFGSGGDADNLAGQSQFVAPNHRLLIGSIGHYDVTDHVKAYFETEFAQSTAILGAAQPSYQSAFFAGQKGAAPIKFTTDNPFLSPQAAAVLNAAGASTFYVSRANLDISPQSTTNDSTTYRVVAGIKGDFELGGRKINWDTAFNYGHSESRLTYYDINETNFLNAIDVVKDPATGRIVCAVTLTPPAVPAGGGGQPTSVTGCQPLNLFGAGAPSAAARAYVTAQDLAMSILTQRDFQINANGSPFDIWAGPVQLAAGFEYREEGGSYNVDAFAAAGLGRAAATSDVAGSYKSREVYTEVNIPVVSPDMGWKFIHSAEIDGSFRRIDNSYAGVSNVYTIGGKFSPIRDIEFRGNFTHSVRAPSIGELFLPTTNTQSFAQDPCDPNFISSKPERQANCAAVFKTLGANLATFKSNVVNASVLGTTGGNPKLLNERADAWTAGFVTRPRFIPGLTLALDWIDIQLKDPITSLSLTQVMNACYDTSSFPNSFCNLFQRDAGGQVTSFSTPLVNAGAQGFNGAQLDMTYTFGVGSLPVIRWLGMPEGNDYGTLTFDISGFYTNRHDFTILGVTTPTRGNIGDPKVRLNVSGRYTRGPFNVYLQARHLSSGSSDVTLPAKSQEILTAKAYTVFNGSLGYDITKNVTAQLVVNNVFNTAPPAYAISLSSNAALGSYDYLGQFFAFKIKVKV